MFLYSLQISHHDVLGGESKRATHGRRQKINSERVQGHWYSLFSKTVQHPMKPIQIVVDTNIVIAGMRSKTGVSNAFLRRLNDPRLKFHISNALLLEYEEVLRREQTALGLSDQDIDDLLDGFCAIGEKHYRLFTWRPVSGDPDDDFLVELALSARVDYLVTYNLRDLQFVEQYGITLVTPLGVLDMLRNTMT